VVIKEANRTAMEEEAPGFILFPGQVAHPMTALILNNRKSRKYLRGIVIREPLVCCLTISQMGR
jgi:hypothetical protein